MEPSLPPLEYIKYQQTHTANGTPVAYVTVTKPRTATGPFVSLLLPAPPTPALVRQALAERSAQSGVTFGVLADAEVRWRLVAKDSSLVATEPSQTFTL